VSLAWYGRHRRRSRLYGWMLRHFVEPVAERPVDDYSVPRSRPALIRPYERTPR
jgi:hypothetical protein